MKGRMGSWDAKIAPIAANGMHTNTAGNVINMVQKAEDAT
jgi:hypothetical protein